ncbi:MAG: hypothetical protein JWO85_2669 [Candidatus Eremiobacteraeota bacterium]|nr:hypothetical protein [Candidatus Eremiobacteraeota bacterium]
MTQTRHDIIRWQVLQYAADLYLETLISEAPGGDSTDPGFRIMQAIGVNSAGFSPAQAFMIAFTLGLEVGAAIEAGGDPQQRITTAYDEAKKEVGEAIASNAAPDDDDNEKP